MMTERKERCVTKYPNITVQLTGQDGNAFFILGTIQKALRDAEVPNPEIDEFYREATSDDYDHLLRTCAEWVEVV